jgi:hypothetical protein
MKKANCRCYDTTYTYPFVKFNFICAINNGKIIGYKLYNDRGYVDAEKFSAFYDECIKNI